jgi:hypothetical protein
MSQSEKNVSRRKFLTGAGGALAGTAVGFLGHGLLSSPDPAMAKQSEKWPWPYKSLDTEEARKRGHLGYYKGDCSAGAFYGIISGLREKVGAPYTNVPMEIMGFGGGGVAGWCTLCGALNGACAVMSLTSKDFYKLSNELVAWYCQTPFPSDKSNELGKNHEFLVDELKSDKVFRQTVSGSPLCHVSVTKWCKETGCTAGAGERSERCVRMVGDVCAKAVKILNAYHKGAFKPEHEPYAMSQSCQSCHCMDKSYGLGGFTRGKMDCTDCHIKGAVFFDRSGESSLKPF